MRHGEGPFPGAKKMGLNHGFRPAERRDCRLTDYLGSGSQSNSLAIRVLDIMLCIFAGGGG